MARPTGHRVSKKAWDDIVRIQQTSLTEVATRADVPRPTISALVNGHHGASVPMARKIAIALDVHAETLFPTLMLDAAETAA